MKLNHFGQTVRVAVLGLGSRSVSQMNTLLEMKDVDVTSVCDSYQDRVDQVADIVTTARGRRPFATTDHDAAIERADSEASDLIGRGKNTVSSKISLLLPDQV